MPCWSDCLGFSWWLLNDTIRQVRESPRCTNPSTWAQNPCALCKRLFPYLLLLTCFFAAGITFFASWSCTTFTAEFIPDDMSWYFGGGFGVWTVMDGNLECQLWSTLFFAHSLGPSLHMARASSMIAMLAGLAALAMLTQTLPCRWLNWICMLGLFGWIAESYSAFARFNLWSTFFALTYIFFVAGSRCTLWCSLGFQRRIIRSLFAIALVSSFGIFFILAGNVCNCSYLRQVLQSGLSKFGNATMTDDDFLLQYDLVDPNLCNDTCQSIGLAPILSPVFWLLCWFTFPYCWTHSYKTPAVNAPDEESRNPSGFIWNKEVSAAFESSVTDLYFGDKDHVIQGDLEKDSRHSNRDFVVEKRAASETNEVDVVALQMDDYQCDDLNSQRSRRLCWCIRIFILTTLFICYVFLVVLMIGAFVENANAAEAPDTSHNFVIDSVCALNPLDPDEAYVTFDSKHEAVAAGFEVVHCGECARCSNPKDIETYVSTRKTVAKSAKRCSKTTIFGTYGELVDCLEDEIGFSRPCTECWADNMQTTARYCLFTCLSSLLTGNTKSNNLEHADDYHWLNQCIFCDEKRSGPAFVQCSGVARRRLGIHSEIERNPAEQCQAVDFDFITETTSNYYFDLY